MRQFSTSANRDRGPAISRPALLGCGGLLAGLIIGALLMLLGLIAFAPRLQTAAPGSADPNGDLTITMDDAYLTQVLGSAISQSSLPISLSNVQAEIQPNNQVKISADTSGAFPVGVQLTALTQLSVQSGHLAMRIASAQVGGLPLPAGVVSALEQQFNSRLMQASSVLLPSNYMVTAIHTTEHHLQMSIAQS
jgi:hypothetical protein